MSNEFTEKWTQKTFTNPEGLQLIIKNDDDDADVICILIGNEEWWFPKKFAGAITEAIHTVASN